MSRTYIELPVWLWLSLCASIVFAGTTALVWWWAQPGPPVQFKGVEVMTRLVESGSRVSMTFDVDRTRACPALIMGFWVDPLTGLAVLRLPMVSGGYGLIGNGVHTAVAVDAPAEPGHYCYRATMLHICGERAYADRTPDACVDVLPTAELAVP